MNRILLIDDDPNILNLNKKYLITRGYHVQTAENCEIALLLLGKDTFDCIVLDVMLPDGSGFDLCGQLRKISNAPVIFLSCKDHEDDKISGLLSGGDDYVTKPFSMRELEARIGAQIRRAGGLLFDKNNRVVFYRTQSILLSQTEFDILLVLYDNRSRILSSQELSATLGDKEKKDNNMIAVYIRRLRKKLETFGDTFSIQTIRASGYRFFEK